MSWVLVPCLMRLRSDLNEIAPGRDRTTDGSVGDANHSSTSDHTPDEISDALRDKDADSKNEVHALDLDADLRTPNLTMEMVVQHILARCRSGKESRLRYMIFNRRIWEASNGWRQRAYTGSSPHTEHAHFSASYVTAREADTSSWRLEDIPVALTQADKNWLVAQIDARADQLRTEIRADIAANNDDQAAAVWGSRLDIDTSAKGVNLQPAGGILAYTSSEHHRIEDIATAIDGKVQQLLDAGKPQDV